MRIAPGPGPAFTLALLALTLLVARAAATTPLAPPRSPEAPLRSVPVRSEAPPGQGVVMLDELRPDGRARLVATRHGVDALPGLGLEDLDRWGRAYALAVLNGTIAACEPCWLAGKSMAQCLIDDPEGCEVMPRLARRAVRLSGEGRPPPEVRELVDFHDAWLPQPSFALPGDPLEGATLPVWVAVDYASPFSAEAEPVWAALREAYGGALALARVMAPREDLAAREAARFALVGRERGCFEALHPRLLALAGPALTGDIPPTEALGRAFAEAGCGALPGPDEGRAELEAHLALAASLGVRGTPTAFVLGHRVRGLRDASAYARILDARLGDGP